MIPVAKQLKHQSEGFVSWRWTHCWGQVVTNSPVSQQFFPRGEQPENRKLPPENYHNQLPIVYQYFTNIAAMQNMGVSQ